MVTCLLLSAGLSQRFGSPKALAQCNDQTVIEHLQKMLIDTQVSEIIVVLGAGAEQIKPYLLNHKKVRFVYNKDYKFGQTSSFKAGLEDISSGTRGIMLLPVDFPLIGGQTIDVLVQYFSENNPRILIPTFEGQKGHPPLFSADLHEEFLSLKNESGINSVAQNHQTETALLPVEDKGVVSSFNTLAEFKSLMNCE